MYKYIYAYTRTSEPNHLWMCTMRNNICVSHFARSPHKIDVPYLTLVTDRILDATLPSNFVVVYYWIAEGNGSRNYAHFK